MGLGPCCAPLGQGSDLDLGLVLLVLGGVGPSTLVSLGHSWLSGEAGRLCPCRLMTSSWKILIACNPPSSPNTSPT